jgi:hypothetical protein
MEARRRDADRHGDDTNGVVVKIPAGRIRMGTSGSGVLIAWITSDGFVYTRRFASDLTALEAGPINVAGTGGTRSAVTAAFLGGECVVAWSQPLGPMNSRQSVIYLQRVASDGTVRGLTPPPNALPGVYSSLASSIPPLPSYSYNGGYALPSVGVGSSAGMLVYVSGTSNGMTHSERASGIQGVRVHPFARQSRQHKGPPDVVRRPSSRPAGGCYAASRSIGRSSEAVEVRSIASECSAR